MVPAQKVVQGAVVLSLKLRHFLGQNRGYLIVGFLVFWSCAYFFQGGGWNQNAHLATVTALWEDGSLQIDKYGKSTGDVARNEYGLVSVKPIGTALLASPGFAVASLLTMGISNKGNRVILRSYFTTLFSAGVALTAAALLLFGWFRKRLSESEAVLLAVAICLATPLWPNSTMLTPTAFVTLAVVAGLRMLDSLNDSSVSVVFCWAIGLVVSIPAALEHTDTLILFPIGIYLAYKTQSVVKSFAFALGVACIATVPLIHHTVAYGHPLSFSYHHVVVDDFVKNHSTGFMGYGMPNLGTLYKLTFGQARGYFFLSPFLIGMVPGFLRLIREENARRAFGISVFSAAWLLLLAISSLAFWDSGSATGSRFGYLFIVLSSAFVVVIYPYHKLWMNVGMITGYAIAIIANSTTALPPSTKGGSYNVVEFWWQRFSVGTIPSWSQEILIHSEWGTGNPTISFAFNLGRLAGIRGVASVVPYIIVMSLAVGLYIWSVRKANDITYSKDQLNG